MKQRIIFLVLTLLLFIGLIISLAIPKLFLVRKFETANDIVIPPSEDKDKEVKKSDWLMTHTLSGGLTPCGNETKLTLFENGEYLYEITPAYEGPPGCPKNKSTKKGDISPSELEELNKILSDPSLLSLKDKYENPSGVETLDLPIHIFSFKIGDKTKEITVLQPIEKLPKVLEDIYTFSLRIREKYLWEKNL